MIFIDEFELSSAKPAPYNPRKISEDSFKKLQESLKRFGVCKPIILNKDFTLVAGHQRTKAMNAIGITKCPAFITEKRITTHNEINFNMFHNSIEENCYDVTVMFANKIPLGYSRVNIKDVKVNNKEKVAAAAVVKEIARLINLYGEYSNVIIDETGRVIDNSDYAYASILLNKDLIVYKMTNEEAQNFTEYMRVDYGEYSYDALATKPYVQTLCQMHRSETKKSTLYEDIVLKYVKKNMRIVDFGAGEMWYIKKA